MMGNRYRTGLWFVLAVVVVGLMLLAWAPQSSHAELPSRFTPTPIPPFGEDRGKADKAVGAHIELQVHGAPAGTWAVVQWSSAANWDDVDGWRGRLDQAGRQVWWVSPKDFGTGPLRWLVTEGPDGQELGASEPFTLPDTVSQITRVELNIGP